MKLIKPKFMYHTPDIKDKRYLYTNFSSIDIDYKTKTLYGIKTYTNSKNTTKKQVIFYINNYSKPTNIDSDNIYTGRYFYSSLAKANGVAIYKNTLYIATSKNKIIIMDTTNNLISIKDFIESSEFKSITAITHYMHDYFIIKAARKGTRGYYIVSIRDNKLTFKRKLSYKCPIDDKKLAYQDIFYNKDDDYLYIPASTKINNHKTSYIFRLEVLADKYATDEEYIRIDSDKKFEVESLSINSKDTMILAVNADPYDGIYKIPNITDVYEE